ncbi:MAG: DUF2799 domain-containing protein [Candidatus Thiothrix sulfatifontis]|nr:MAG: DUF2799 domain-containing protein [Candidatus Thiothrix sulfatifontis]
MKRVMIISGLSLLLASCASLEPEECKTADWERLGYADAMAGRDIRLADYNKDCGKIGITPNEQVYKRSYDQGAKAFCTYENGREVGKRGSFDSKVCDKPGLAEPFKKGYIEGYDYYLIQQKLAHQQSEIRELEKKLKEQENANKSKQTPAPEQPQEPEQNPVPEQSKELDN